MIKWESYGAEIGVSEDGEGSVCASVSGGRDRCGDGEGSVCVCVCICEWWWGGGGGEGVVGRNGKILISPYDVLLFFMLTFREDFCL